MRTKHFILSTFLLFGFLGIAQNSAESGSFANTERLSKSKVKVFPNPATNVINVLGLENTAKADISILDIYGNTVLAHQWEIRRNAINIPIATLDSGAYIINIISEEQQVRTKFIKQ